MPRRPRIHIDGVPLHIVQRGHNRERCFVAADDYHCYLRWLDAALRDIGGSLHAYALMTNHVHLLVTPGTAARIPELMISLGRRYVQYVNRTYRRTGTLWDSRYKSSIVQAESYFLVCQRYIESNPVRAAMVEDAADYRWTSYRANAMGQSDAMLVPHPVYMALGRSASARQLAYRALFNAYVYRPGIDAIRRALNQNRPLGDAAFQAEIERVTGIRCEVRPRGRPRMQRDVGENAEGLGRAAQLE